MRRLSCFVLLLLCAALSAAELPLSPNPCPQKGEGNEVINLQFWGWQSREMDEIFEQYSRDHPNIHVTIAQSASRNMTDDPQRVVCSIVGGDPPDIILFDRYAVGEWAARGAFMPLDAFVAADLAAKRPDAIRQEDYYVPCWEEAHFQGKLFGIPTGTDNRALFYNKDMLSRRGWWMKRARPSRRRIGKNCASTPSS